MMTVKSALKIVALVKMKKNVQHASMEIMDKPVKKVVVFIVKEVHANYRENAIVKASIMVLYVIKIARDARKMGVKIKMEFAMIIIVLIIIMIPECVMKLAQKTV